MKKYLYILSLLLIVGFPVYAQEDSVAIVSAWSLDENFIGYQDEKIDTLLTDFQVYFPNYKKSVSNAFLGNIGTPSISNIFVDRLAAHSDVFFMNQFYPYFHTAENSIYYNTRKPFSYLTYIHGGPKENAEETFEAMITENVDPKLNFALTYRYIASKGQYNFQQVRQSTFQGTVNYTRPKYVVYASVNFNNQKANENGGIIDSVFETHGYGYLNEIPTRILGTGEDSYARNDLKHFDLMINQRLKLFTIASKVDTTQPEKKRNIAEPVLSYTIRAQRAAKRYEHLYPYACGIYDVNYFNAKKTFDSIANFRLTNRLNLEFKTTFRGKVQIGIYGSLANEIDKYSMFSQWDTTYVPGKDTLVTPVITQSGDTLKGIDFTDHNSSTCFSAGLYGVFWNKVRSDFSTKLYFLGYKAGETNTTGRLSTEIDIFKRTFLFDVEVGLKNKVPSFLLQNYYSNHYIWEEQSLNSEIWTSLSGKIAALSNNFELTGNYYLISGLIYFDEDAKPVNYENPVNVLSLELAKTFKLWKLYSKNKLVYQVSEDQEILAIPNLVYYTSTYFNHKFHFESTGGELEMMLGVDFFYTTKYLGYEYSPALSQFYTQDSKLIGGFPMLDVFLNLKLKRVRFFLKLQHVNSLIGAQDYYAAIHYPHNQVMNSNQLVFKFGISWAFYD